MQQGQLRNIGEFIKENKKRFYGNIWRNYGNIQLLDLDHGDWADMMPSYFWHSYEDKNYARELKVIYLAAQDRKLLRWWDYVESREDIARVCERLHKTYWKRFHKIYGQRAKDNRGWPQRMTKTQGIRELIAMGWVHIDDLRWEPLKCEENMCISHIADLWWPKTFKHHIHAINMPYHLPGFTGTKTPKDK